MSIGQKKYEKGPAGYLFDMRKAVGRLCEASKQWCEAFDVGDGDATAHLTQLMTEALKDFGDAAEVLQKLDNKGEL